MFERPPLPAAHVGPKPVEEVNEAHNQESKEQILSLQELHESAMRFGPLAPLIMSLAACSSLEQRHESGLETQTYEDIPPHYAEQLKQKLGFTKEIADRCYLQLDADAVGENDAPPVLMIGQVHAPRIAFPTIADYQEVNIPEAERRVLDGIMQSIPHNQEAVRNLLYSMSQNKGEPVMVMPESIYPSTVGFYEYMREDLRGIKAALDSIHDAEGVRSYWNNVKQSPVFAEELPGDAPRVNTIFTLLAIELFLDHLQYQTMSSEKNSVAEQLQQELRSHPHANMTKQEWSWYVGGDLDAFARGWVDITGADVIDPRLEEAVFNASSSPDAFEKYNAVQQERDQGIIQRTHEAGGGVLVMGLSHSYTEHGAVTCVPRLENGASYHWAISQFVGSLAKTDNPSGEPLK